MQNLLFSFEVVGPVFLIILLGFVLRRREVITDEFISVSSRLVFTVALPVFVFIRLSSTDLFMVFDANVVLLSVGATITIFIFAWVLAIFTIRDGRSQGPFIQGTYRSNFGIIGFVIIYNMYGEAGLGKAAIVLSATMPIYNSLAVMALTIPVKKDRNMKFGSIGMDILTNPLNIATLCGICVSILHLPLGTIIVKTGHYLAAMTLPLALIGVGGSLTFYSIRNSFNEAIIAALIKIVVYPLLFGAIAYYFGFRGEDFGILFILFACPTAIVSFIMAQTMNSNADLAANIILLSTIGSVVTLSVGIFLLKSFGLI